MCFCSNTPKALIQWLLWVQFCYSIAWHSSLKLTPYQALHGREPPTLLSYVPGTAQHSEVNQLLINRDELLKEIHHHSTKAQERMKLNADKHGREATFHVGHLVYVKLRPYRQHSIVRYSKQSLAPRYSGPYNVVRCVSEVAYQVQLPPDAKIDDVFHVSMLKPASKETSFVI